MRIFFLVLIASILLYKKYVEKTIDTAFVFYIVKLVAAVIYACLRSYKKVRGSAVTINACICFAVLFGFPFFREFASPSFVGGVFSLKSL